MIYSQTLDVTDICYTGPSVRIVTVINLMHKFDKLVIADEMLETAIESYLDKKRYFSSLHLAGAAQEIYGKWIRINGGQDFSTAMLDLYEKNIDEPLDRKEIKKEDKRPKNTIKHFDNKNDRFAFLNPQLDSFVLISEAVTEHLILKREETVNIKRFRKHIINQMSESSL